MIPTSRTVRGTYGSSRTPCNVYVYECESGTWYTVEGSRGVNLTRDPITHGVNVEHLRDVDCFTFSEIYSEGDLAEAVNS